MHRHALLLSFVVLAAPPPPAAWAERLPIKTYTTAEGLAHNVINRIVKDSRGFLWFCTAGGLSRYDGYAFTNFTVEQGLPDPVVNDLLETRGGEYWVATDGGLVYFDPKGRPAAHGTDRNPADRRNPMFAAVATASGERRAQVVRVLLEDRAGVIWAGTADALFRMQQTGGLPSLRSVAIGIPAEPDQRIISDVLEDRQGALWIAASSGLYRRQADGSSSRFTLQDGLPIESPSDLLEDRQGQLWVATRLRGIFRLSRGSAHAAPVADVTIRTPNGLPGEWAFQLFENAERRFWAGTPRGLAEILIGGDGRVQGVRTYDERHGLGAFEISSLAEDLAGNLWLGTNTAGAMKLVRGGFISFGEQDGIKAVHAILEDRAGNLCFRGTGPGEPHIQPMDRALGCFAGARADWFKPAAVTYFGWVPEQLTLQTRSGEWWVGTGEGLYRFASADNLASVKTARPIAVYTIDDGLAANQIYKLFEDSRGDVWVSTTSPDKIGLGRWDRLSGRVRDLAGTPGVPSLDGKWTARAFGEDAQGNVWIGFDGELVRYAKGRFTLFTSREGLPDGAIKSIHVDRTGRLWLASSRSGLIRVDDPGGDAPTFISYTTIQGLSSNDKEVIAEDPNGRIYVGGSHGLDRLDPATGRVRRFTTADGLGPGLFRAAFRDRHDVLWFGMTGGLVRLDPTTEPASAPPPVLISGLSVAGIPQPVSALGEERMSLPDFEPHHNQLRIDFGGLSFASGEVLRYQYQLRGAEIGWSPLSEGRSVTYATLGPGRYQFDVRAVNSDGIESAQPASVTFTILRPVWLRWWFLTLAGLTAALMAYALYRYRVARLLEMANMRTRIATDLHDDIGANLTRIALLSEVAQQSVPDDGPLASIASIARESVSSMGDIVWAINPQRESLRDLIRRMRQHADEIFTLRDIELRFTAPVAPLDLKLGMDVRRDVFLLFKEVVNNAARHSECSKVQIDLRVDSSRLLLTVIDNGVGFDPSIEKDGQGLTSMRQRAHRLNGELTVNSSKGAGTTVALDVPL